MIITLDKLTPRQKAIVMSKGLNQAPLKLLEFGFLEGEIIEMIGTAPLGDPFLIYVNQVKIAIGRDIAEQVEVEVIR